MQVSFTGSGGFAYDFTSVNFLGSIFNASLALSTAGSAAFNASAAYCYFYVISAS